MKTRFLVLLLLAAMLLSFSFAFAQGPPPFRLPPQARQIAPGVFDLGFAIDRATGLQVQGLAVFHHRTGHGGGPGVEDPGGEDPPSSCFAFLANGARWNTTEPYLVDPSNNAGLDNAVLNLATVIDQTSASLGEWDDEVTTFNIFGVEVAGTVDGIDLVQPDGFNEVLFGDIAQDGAIAVAIVWGVFRGPPFARGLVEWDVLFDDVDFAWSTSGVVGLMDYQNIATHEFGHAAGMGHPDNSCIEETMYAFAGLGETIKRDLNAGDIAGINELYP